MSGEYLFDFGAGDAFYLTLDYTINDVPIEDYDLDEIEFSFCGRNFLLSTGDIFVDEDTGKYVLLIPQDATLGMGGIAEWKVRFRRGEEVVSDEVQELRVGRGLSMEVI